jgi:hypothetical protein
VSTVEPPQPPVAEPVPPAAPAAVAQHRAPAALRCPRCGATVAPEQDWCLECGAPARTRLAPTPRWGIPVAVVVALIAAAGLALALAFVALTDDDGAVVTTTAPATAPIQPNETPTSTVAGSNLPGGTGVLEPGAASTATPSTTAAPASTGAPAAP